MEDEDIKKMETQENPENGVLYVPPSSGSSDYSNISASIAISALATTIIAIGTPMIMAEKPFGYALIVLGLIVYFVKAYLLKKGCI
jgi:hypothetical protein